MCSFSTNKQSDKDHFRTNLSSEKIEKYESRKIIYILCNSLDKYGQSQFKLWRKLEGKLLAMVAKFWITFGKLLRRSSYRYVDSLSWDKFSSDNTVWKFFDFCIIQVLCEINFVDSWTTKSAILLHLEALNYDFYEFLHFLKAEIYQMNKIHCH